MGKVLSYLKRNLKLAFKTVTYQFRQYLCFYIALFIVEMLFGIVVMTANNTAYLKKTSTDMEYDYHVSVTGLNKNQYDYMRKLDKSGYKGPSKGEIAPLAPNGVNKAVKYVDSKKIGASYDMYYLFYDGQDTDIRELYGRFKELYVDDLTRLQSGNWRITLSPRYYSDIGAMGVGGNCAVWLLVLAAASVITLILLYGIRINHFKFMYGIYTSFGADSKKLFGTCFWELYVISFLTLIPAGGAATLASWFFFKSSALAYQFAPQLILFAPLFMLPVTAISVFLPIKTTAVQSPVKLLLAEDNSNLVTAPYTSSFMKAKRFTSSYEKIGISRFRRYIAQLVLSSVLMSALFVLISFYCGIYDHGIGTAREEFTVSFPQHEVKTTQKVEIETDAWDLFFNARRAIYKEGLEFGNNSDVAEFEKFYDSSRYTLTIEGYVGVTEVIEIATGDNVYSRYTDARSKVVDVHPSSLEMKNFEALFFDVENYKVTWDAYGKVASFMKITYEDREVTKLVGDTYTNDKGIELKEMYGVTEIYKYCKTAAFTIPSYVAFDKEDTKLGSFIENPSVSDEKVTLYADYYAADSDIVKFIETHFQYEGNALGITQSKNNVIISDCINNSRKLKIKPGDKITIRVYKEPKNNAKDPTKNNVIDGERYLQNLIKNGVFEEKEFTVCAVIKDMNTAQNLPIFMSEDDYKLITGETPIYNSVSVYVDPMLGNNDIDELHDNIKYWADQYSDTEVTHLNSLAESRAERETQKLPILYTFATMLLILAPLFWFFSQIMFYHKRAREFELLRDMGATEKTVRKIFVYDGMVLAALGCAALAVMSAAGIGLIYLVTVKLSPYIAQSVMVRYSFKMPLIPFVAAMAVTVISAFFASVVSYRINKKSAKKRFVR